MAENIGSKKENIHKKQSRTPNKNYSFKKRLPIKRVEGNNVIYVTRKTSFKAQLEKCCELLTKGENEIILHGLGAAIQRCCNLALQVKNNFHGVCDLEVNTSTTDLIDDLEPMTDDLEFGSQVRQTSSIHIRIFRTVLLAANQ